MIATVCVVLFAAVPASAGQFKVTVTATGSGCGLLGAYGNSIPLYATQCEVERCRWDSMPAL